MNERKTSAAKAKRKTLNTRKRKVRQTGRRKRGIECKPLILILHHAKFQHINKTYITKHLYIKSLFFTR